LFRSQPGRRLPKQRQELMLIFSHISPPNIGASPFPEVRFV
jgi:hypothetical protein